MVVGLGIDLVSVERIERALAKHNRFRDKLFTRAEQAYCESQKRPALHYAARFAAKEAGIKALGRAVPFREIEVTRSQVGKPGLRFHGKAAQLAGTASSQVSLSHTEEYACAVLILER